MLFRSTLLSRLSITSFLILSLVFFLLLLSFVLQESLIEDLVLPGKFLKVGSEISYLFFHRRHIWRLATGGEGLSVDFH